MRSTADERDRFFKVFDEEVERKLTREPFRGSLAPGVLETLEAISRDHACEQVIVTGNTRRVAQLKLRAFGVERYFDSKAGAYGEESADRAALVRMAMSRTRGAEDITVIGDTVHDAKAARSVGVECLIVGSKHKVEIESLGARGISNISDIPNMYRLVGNDLSHN